MKLSAQEEYGLRCLLYMARHGETRSHSIPEISRAEGLSVPNVAKLMRILRLGGLVASVRGQSGGYTLSRTSEHISVAEVLSLLGGSFYTEQFCTRHSGLERNCAHTGDCSVRLLWRTVQQTLDGILRQTTLNDLLKPEPEMTDFLNTLVAQPHLASEPVGAGVSGF